MSSMQNNEDNELCSTIKEWLNKKDQVKKLHTMATSMQHLQIYDM